MHYQYKINSRRLSSEHAQKRRNQFGAISPVVIFSLTTIAAFLAFSVDVMRTVHANEAIQFASQASGIHAYQNIFYGDGQRRSGSIEELAMNSLQQSGGATSVPWNLAPAGPKNEVAQTPVTFETSDVTVVSNSNAGDPNDFFLQIRARREGNDALTMMFMPVIFAFNSWSGSATPPNTDKATPFRVSEVITQPATRLGAGPQRGGAINEPASGFAGFASFPLAISNKQFLSISQNASAGAVVTIDIVNSAQAPSTTAAGTAHVRGSFVNVYHTGGLNYYGDAVGSLAISQLNSTMQYFAGAPSGTILSPAVVERGSMLAAFDAGDSTFKTNASNITSAVTRGITPARFHSIPVLADDPKFNQRNQVIGFARLQLTQVLRNATTGAITVTAVVGESVPMYNATIGTGLASVPSFNGTAIPPAVAPFLPRQFNAINNTVGSRPVGIVMSPALSPRRIQGGPL
ncbi:MAG: hypothetical protein SGJ27_22140 [Candidatus Melainabacteria bacterium]|nr:hypothetical protein [Candidatus Melainabacteria bacterium]